jgi:hypothetical protein
MKKVLFSSCLLLVALISLYAVASATNLSMANEPKITIDTREVEPLSREFREIAEEGLQNTAERGAQLMAEEAPKITGNLRLGMSADIDRANLTAELIASAVTREVGSEGALLHLPSGATREITLRSQPAHNYAEDVARGTGTFGPRGQLIRPKTGKALLIPVGSVPLSVTGKPESYVTSGGKTYVLRRFSKGRKANEYDVRAAQRLEAEIPGIWEAVVNIFAERRQNPSSQG